MDIVLTVSDKELIRILESFSNPDGTIGTLDTVGASLLTYLKSRVLEHEVAQAASIKRAEIGAEKWESKIVIQASKRPNVDLP
mgnify:CR=1 FL=1